MSDLSRATRSLTDRAIDAVEILEKGLRHLQMEAGDAGVSWFDDTGNIRYQPLSDYVDWVIDKAKNKAKET